ncbi:hypothetical protein P7D50_09455 [Enterococcus dongliensis]|uniref:hypothetical protein n=1 Tax=Enterococcus dongliensis TaxID=2559925 RepID=UPI00288C9B3C|nr:hypothetical protein [Enterococcus dongliensis]MDT2648022.1 hypothetical protein [Enterococcus dongliensis]
MKTIYKVLYPLGYEEHEVADDFPTTLPFVAVPPLELENTQSQFFNFSKNKWEEAVTQDYSEKIELLENISTGLQAENERLAETVALQDTQLTDTQLALAEVYEMSVPLSKEV